MVDSVSVTERVSALSGHYNTGKIGAVDAEGEVGIILEYMHDLVLHQIAAWPETLDEVAAIIANIVGAKSAPGPCSAAAGKQGGLLRIEPLKWLMYGAAAPKLAAEQAVSLDLSHSRTHVRVSGVKAASLLNRHLSLDLREKSFPIGSVASTAFHHCGITVWRSDDGFEIFLPRGFALALWEILVESAEQFGVEVV